MSEQTMRFTTGEIDLLKQLFQDNDYLLEILGRRMLQLDVSAKDREMITEALNKPDIIRLMKKLFIPTLNDENTPIDFLQDSFSTLTMVDKFPEFAKWLVEARHQSVAYINQQIDAIAGMVIETVRFADFINIKEKEATEVYKNLQTRNETIVTIQSIIRVIKAHVKRPESEEVITEKMKKNSNK